jgi:PAS domain S-box-containing protein
MNNHPRILIVEDEPIVAADLKVRLDLLGCQVVGSAPSGEKALTLAGQLLPDLVLMDIRLEGPMDGIETAQQVRQRWRLPVVYLTAYADDTTLQRAKVTEPFGYILKPFEDRELKTVIEMALYKHQAEEKLQKSEEKFSKAFQASPTIMTIVSLKDRRYIEVNRAFEQYTGYTRDEVLNHTTSEVELWSNPQELEQAFRKLITEGSYRDVEARFRSKRGELHIARLSAEIVEFGGERCILTVAEDITDRKKAEEELNQHRDHLEEMVKERTAELEAFYRAMIGREERVIELKEEVNRLCTELNRSPAYPPVWRKDGSAGGAHGGPGKV